MAHQQTLNQQQKIKAANSKEIALAKRAKALKTNLKRRKEAYVKQKSGNT